MPCEKIIRNLHFIKKSSWLAITNSYSAQHRFVCINFESFVPSAVSMQYLSEIWMVHVPSIYVVISFSQTNIFELALIDFFGDTLSHQLFLVSSLADVILMA